LKYAFLGADEILMAKLFMLIILLLGTVLLFGSLGGCMNSGSNPDDENLIQVRDRVLTVLEFNQAFEIAKTAYPHNLRFDRDDFKTAQLRLLNQLMVEMIILERAEELGLDISDEDVEQAVAEIKKDYPEDTFEETLLEFAVSYESWEIRLRNRLLMEKVVESELKDQIVINPEDIANYYNKNFKTQEPDSDQAANIKDINEMIIKHLRRAKTEEAYKKWIKKLKQQYSIEVNSSQWEKISEAHYREEENPETLNTVNE
jgi:hypothetical protein